MLNMLDISPKEKEAKIEKVRNLIPKYYDEYSIVSPIKLVSRISKILKPNQWLRVENSKYGSYNYDKPIKYSQKIDMKPFGIWASKGEWNLSSNTLTLLEVDYSRILVLTTKADYLEFENKYCHKKLIKPDWHPKRRTKRPSRIIKLFNQNGGNNSKKNLRNSTGLKLVCVFRIDWPAVAKEYDGIALIPNPTPYFLPDSRYLQDHLWLKTYDVSSLVVWVHNGNKPITKHIIVGDIAEMKKQAKYKDWYDKPDDNYIVRMKTEKKFHNIVIKNIKDAIDKLEKENAENEVQVK